MIYLDHAATTNVLPEVLDAMLPWFRKDHVGNPGSIHSQGVNAKKAIENARVQVARLINAEPSEIVFTSGGTESNNTWMASVSTDEDFDILTTEVEHSSVARSVEESLYLCTSDVYKIAVDENGIVDPNNLRLELKEHREYRDGWGYLTQIGAVSVMWVNNELGSINPIEEIGEICRENKVLFHTDAVQAVGHIPIDVKKCNVDMLSMTGHKFGAPLGIGALYIRHGVQKTPVILGGGQESGMRSGTENVPGIVGLGKAAELAGKRLQERMSSWENCRNVLLGGLYRDMSGEFRVNGVEGAHVPNIVSLTIPGVNSESLLLLLDMRGICVSSGSACNASSSAPSHVLTAIGLSPEDAASTIRISMGFDTTAEEMTETAKEIADCVHKMKARIPFFTTIKRKKSIF